MNLSRPARTKLGRALVRAPIWLYRTELGWLLGGRFLLLTHTGRKSGRPRQVVLEVVGHDRPSGGYLVASGYGTRAQWYRNILADPQVRFQVGRRRYQGLARPLPPAESGRQLAGYAHRHPPRRSGPAADHRPGGGRLGGGLRADRLRPRPRDPAGCPRAAVTGS